MPRNLKSLISLSVFAFIGCSESGPLVNSGHTDPIKEIENADAVYLATDKPGDGIIEWVVDEVLKESDSGDSPIKIGYVEAPLDPSETIHYPEQILILATRGGESTTSLSVFDGMIHTNDSPVALEEVRQRLATP